MIEFTHFSASIKSSFGSRKNDEILKVTVKSGIHCHYQFIHDFTCPFEPPKRVANVLGGKCIVYL